MAGFRRKRPDPEHGASCRQIGGRRLLDGRTGTTGASSARRAPLSAHRSRGRAPLAASARLLPPRLRTESITVVLAVTGSACCKACEDRSEPQGARHERPGVHQLARPTIEGGQLITGRLNPLFGEACSEDQIRLQGVTRMSTGGQR